MNRRVKTIVAINRAIVAFSVITLVTSGLLFGVAITFMNYIIAMPSLMIGFWLILVCVLALIGATKVNYTLMLMCAIGT